MSRFVLVCALCAPALLLGQLTSNSITVTASTQTAVNPQPNQAVFDVVVTSGVDKGLDDIVAALQGSGITAANFVGLNLLSSGPVLVVNPAPPGPRAAAPQLRWNFQTVAPLAKLKDTSAAFAALAQSLQQNAGISLTFTVNTTSGPQQPADCSLADLIADARSQAQQLTSAAGVIAGMIQAITTSTPGSCFLTVRFALGTQLMPLQPNSITVTASRSTPLQPDQISMVLNVTSDVNAGVDDITAALQQAGISGVVFTGVYTTSQYSGNPPAQQSRLSWSFTLTAPLSKIKDTLSAILAAQQSLAKASPPLTLSSFGAQVQVSPDLAKSQSCPEADLIKDAQAQAQKVAAAAGVSAGPILGLTGGTTGLAAAARLGSFSIINGLDFSTVSLGVFPGFAPAATCSVSVSFLLQ